MIIVIVHHWCKSDMIGAGRQRIDKAANEMTSAPGFRFRYRIDQRLGQSEHADRVGSGGRFRQVSRWPPGREFE
jgi:hypothetical protein